MCYINWWDYFNNIMDKKFDITLFLFIKEND